MFVFLETTHYRISLVSGRASLANCFISFFIEFRIENSPLVKDKNLPTSEHGKLSNFDKYMTAAKFNITI